MSQRDRSGADDPEPMTASERASAESAERYRSLFAFNPQAAFSLDLAGRYVDANEAGQELTGYSLEELREMDFGSIICPEDLPAVMAAFHEVVNREPRQMEARAVHRDGTYVDLRITAVPVVVGDEVVGVHGIAEDVTEANRLRRELEDARRAAEEATAAKSLFLANMSHEVRTPLTSVLAANEFLDDLELGAPADGLILMIDRSGKRLLRLVNDLLDFSQLERGGLQVVEESFTLRCVLEDLVRPVAVAAAAKGLDFTCTVEDDLPAQLRGDVLRTTQVLDNLLDNAVKFTDRGGVRLTVGVQPGTPGLVRFEVGDTGVGIPEDRLGELFESFTQADPSATRAHDGAGLGLAICRELTVLLDGTLTVRSEAGAGSVFTLVLPLAPLA